MGEGEEAESPPIWGDLGGQKRKAEEEDYRMIYIII